ncbi:MAG: ATP-binding protein [bacterium]|nr:ATP-binding protein [bacterium]
MSKAHSVTVLEASIGVDDPDSLEHDGAYYAEIIRRLNQMRMYIINLIEKTGRFDKIMHITVALEEAAINAAFHGNLERSSAVKDNQDRNAMVRDLEGHCNREMHNRRIAFAACFHTSVPIDQPALEKHTITTTMKNDDDTSNKPEEILDQFDVMAANEEIDSSNITAVSLSIRDEGKGFIPKNVPDPTLPDNILKSHGRGLLLISTFMDAVEYSNGGTTVELLKNVKQ